MAADRLKLLIVGAGQAGARAALAARAVNAAACITLIGEERHLPYERPVLSKGMLLEASPAPCILDRAGAEQAQITLRLGVRATSIDRHAKAIRLSDGAHYAYDKLILATGSRLRVLTLPGAQGDEILYLRTIDDSAALRARLRHGASLAIIGGGFIGLEVAATARKLGCDVTLIEAAQSLLPRLGSTEASAFVERHHQARGVDIRLGVTIVGREADQLQLSDGAAVHADTLLAGIGVSPQTDLAEAAGLAVDNGILTDRFGRTSDSDIFAAGDVANQERPGFGRRLRLESWENANLQGAAAGRAAAGLLTETISVPWFWSDQGDLNIQMAGAPDQVTDTIVRGDFEDGMTVLSLDGAKLVAALTLNRAKDMPLIRRAMAGAGEVDAHALRDSATPLRRALLMA